jgi:hypothetical protein
MTLDTLLRAQLFRYPQLQELMQYITSMDSSTTPQ